jgi:muconolactone D-isomerase
MLFLAEIDVRLPHDLPAAEAEELKAREREMAQDLQHQGTWRHLWRVAGRYANISIFDVESPDELHATLSALPLFPYMEIRVIALAVHPSAIDPDFDIAPDIYHPADREERRER